MTGKSGWSDSIAVGSVGEGEGGNGNGDGGGIGRGSGLSRLSMCFWCNGSGGDNLRSMGGMGCEEGALLSDAMLFGSGSMEF